MATDPPPTAAPRRSFTEGAAFRLLPVALSIVALVVSVGSLYWKDLSDRPHLTVVFADLAVPVTENPEADTGGQTRGTLSARLLLSNPGNRPASLVSAEIELLSQPRPVPRARACRDPASAETLRFPLAGPALPAIVAPGALVTLPVTADILFDWARLHGSRRIESCVIFTTLDNAGITRTRRLPFASWVVGKEADFESIPAPDKPDMPYKLL